jgi:hypothetical protein
MEGTAIQMVITVSLVKQMRAVHSLALDKGRKVRRKDSLSMTWRSTRCSTAEGVVKYMNNSNY